MNPRSYDLNTYYVNVLDSRNSDFSSLFLFFIFIFLCCILKCGRSIMAVSSWNDNGQKQFVHDPSEFSLIFQVDLPKIGIKHNTTFIFSRPIVLM